MSRHYRADRATRPHTRTSPADGTVPHCARIASRGAQVCLAPLAPFANRRRARGVRAEHSAVDMSPAFAASPHPHVPYLYLSRALRLCGDKALSGCSQSSNLVGGHTNKAYPVEIPFRRRFFTFSNHQQNTLTRWSLRWQAATAAAFGGAGAGSARSAVAAARASMVCIPTTAATTTTSAMYCSHHDHAILQSGTHIHTSDQ